jgi:hypothetical protein
MKYVKKIEWFLIHQILTNELRQHPEGSLTYNMINEILKKIKL